MRQLSFLQLTQAVITSTDQIVCHFDIETGGNNSQVDSVVERYRS